MTNLKANRNDARDSFLTYGGVVAVWLLTTGLALHAKNTQTLQHYHLSRTGLHVLLAVLELPTLFIWAAILFAALSFYRYARQIKGSVDSPGFRYMGYSLTAFLVGSLLGSVIGNIQTLLADNASNPELIKQRFVILTNYVALVTSIAAYVYLYRGSKALLNSLKHKPQAGYHYLKILLPVVLVGVLYAVLALHNPNRRVSSSTLLSPTFGLPDALIVLTVVLPTTVAWAYGFLALDGIYSYLKHTPGVVYKYIFHSLARGLGIVIVLTATAQLLTQFSNSLTSASLAVVLEIIAVVYLILVGALIIVARGARRLNKLETMDPGVS